ncbi:MULTISPECIES: hypothetical protein [Pseudomonas]|uniref:hypothetical protein n=1 Tax=Pseudomonas TaxID=286 RepID=UPI001BEB3F7A|nr:MULTISPECIES: hypothetical protein [Pseudomonas]MBT2340535.1 hypothetical protein [Pseudomonas fluorescens]
MERAVEFIDDLQLRLALLVSCTERRVAGHLEIKRLGRGLIGVKAQIGDDHAMVG